MQYRAVIFDLDGTLLNTVEDIAYAMNKVLAMNDYPIHSVEEYNYFVGEGLYNLVVRTVPEQARVPELLNTYLEQLVHEYARCIDTQTKPYSGISEMLDNLSDKNITLAILSNKAHQFMDSVIQTHFARWNFKAVFGARPGIPNKPSPQSALEIASIMELQPSQIVYLGDTDIDMQTAAAAGMYPVGAAWGFRTEDELLTHGAQMIIRHPRELLTLF